MIQELSDKTLEKIEQRREKRKRRKRKIERAKQRALNWHLKRVSDKQARENSWEVATAIACEVLTPEESRVTGRECAVLVPT